MAAAPSTAWSAKVEAMSGPAEDVEATHCTAEAMVVVRVAVMREEEVGVGTAAGVLLLPVAASASVPARAAVFCGIDFATILERSMMASRSASDGMIPESFLKILWCQGEKPNCERITCALWGV